MKNGVPPITFSELVSKVETLSHHENGAVTTALTTTTEHSLLEVSLRFDKHLDLEHTSHIVIVMDGMVFSFQHSDRC